MEILLGLIVLIVLTLFNLQTFCQSVALILWDQLSEGTPQHHQRSVELFYQLHNLVPSSSICEDVISQQLMHRDKVRTVDPLHLGQHPQTHKIRAHTPSLCRHTQSVHAEASFSFREFGWRPM